MRQKVGSGWAGRGGQQKTRRTVEVRRVGIRCLQRPPGRHPEPGFRGARAARRWVHLTRDDHARMAMYQARAHRALVQGTIKPSGFADASILRRLGRPAIKFFERHGLSIDMADAMKNGLRRGRWMDGSAAAPRNTA